VETRLIRPADLPALAALHAASFAEAAWSSSQIDNSLLLPTTLALASVDATGAVAGFILCQIVGGEAEILTFCTAPAQRRRGIGETLLRAALDGAKAKGAQRMLLEVAADNVAAYQLYQKAGFADCGRRRGYYRGDVDALMMARNL
jgi:ribosomal-protein-alanine N-acetyltransferase